MILPRRGTSSRGQPNPPKLYAMTATTSPRIEQPAPRAPHGAPRLLIVTTVPATIDAFLAPYVAHFNASGWEVDVATADGPLSALVVGASSAIHRIPWSRRATDLSGVARAIRMVRRIVRDGRYDIVHVHTPIAASVTRSAIGTIAPSRRPAVVYTAHGFHFQPGSPLRKRLLPQVVEWLGGRCTDRLIVINEADQKTAEQLRLVRPGRVVCMPGIGIDLSWYDTTPELIMRAGRVRTELKLAPHDSLIVLVGELSSRKGQTRAIEALARLGRDDVHLALAGDGPLRAALEAQVNELGLTDQVHLLSHVADVRPLVLASRAMTLPSHREGLSRAVLEALALGVPVVGSDIRGIADSVRPDGGILVPPGDIAALTEAFRTVIDSLPPEPAAQGAIRVRMERYSLASIIAAHEALYDEVRKERRARRAA